MKKLLLLIVSASVLIGGCASQQKSQPQIIKLPQTSTEPAELEVRVDALTQIEREWNAANNVSLRNSKLIALAEQYKDDGQCRKTNIIVSKLNTQLERTETRQNANLLKAECAMSDLEQSTAPLAMIEKWLDSVTLTQFETRKATVKSGLHAFNGEFVLAIDSKLRYSKTVEFDKKQDALNIWTWFSKLSNDERAQLLKRYPHLEAYSKLIGLIENTSLSDVDRQVAIRAWRIEYSDHPLNLSFPSRIENFLNTEMRRFEQIAILLPLSGYLEAQGEAIKQGIMTAYLHILNHNKTDNPARPIPTISFFDTGSDNEMPDSLLNIESSVFSSDLIIGPLLRAHVAQIEAMNVNQVPVIYLNRPEYTSKRNNDIFFSLAPEDEAEQLAKVMINDGVNYPIIISNESAVSQRMLNKFLSSWNEYGNLKRDKTFASRELPVINFSDNKGMRIGITSALDVLQSQNRISQLDSLTKETLHSVTRNRRDIDAFVVFSRPGELELLNPIIESSISLFSTDGLPVYTTSNGYQHKLNKNSVRDLRNMVFIDMPWIMPDGRESQFAKQIDQIWNQPSSTFLRLFAFGYDSFQFAERFAQLKFFEENSLSGLTGELRINQANEVRRTLPIAQVKEEQITLKVE